MYSRNGSGILGIMSAFPVPLPRILELLWWTSPTSSPSVPQC